MCIYIQIRKYIISCCFVINSLCCVDHMKPTQQSLKTPWRSLQWLQQHPAWPVWQWVSNSVGPHSLVLHHHKVISCHLPHTSVATLHRTLSRNWLMPEIMVWSWIPQMTSDHFIRSLLYGGHTKRSLHYWGHVYSGGPRFASPCLTTVRFMGVYISRYTIPR